MFACIMIKESLHQCVPTPSCPDCKPESTVDSCASHPTQWDSLDEASANSPSRHRVRSVLVAHDDRMVIGILRRSLSLEFPWASTGESSSVTSLRNSVLAASPDLVIASVDLPGGDLFSVLSTLRSESACNRFLFLTPRCNYQIVQSMRLLRACGAVDTTSDDIGGFRNALRRIDSGQNYWSGSLRPMLEGSAPAAAALRRLTPRELYLFAILGDGCSDDVAGAMVNLSEQSVHSYRKRLHTKLGIQHRGALISRAFQYGLVRATPEGVDRPGLDLLRARCASSRRGSTTRSTRASATEIEATRSIVASSSGGSL